jgi:hypothetical protein
MGWGNSGTRNPNAPCPPNNPHCQGLPPGADITSWVLGTIIVVAICTVVLLRMQPKLRIKASQFLSLVWMFIIFKKREA